MILINVNLIQTKQVTMTMCLDIIDNAGVPYTYVHVITAFEFDELERMFAFDKFLI